MLPCRLAIQCAQRYFGGYLVARSGTYPALVHFRLNGGRQGQRVRLKFVHAHLAGSKYGAVIVLVTHPHIKLVRAGGAGFR